MAKLMATMSYRLDIKLTGENYDEWSKRLMTVFIAIGVNDIVLGREHLDERRRDKWVNCWEVRRKKAHSHLVQHVEWSVFQGFRYDLRTGNPRVLLDALRERYSEGNGYNPVYLERQLLTRCLGPSERVRKYIDDMMDIRRVLSENRERMTDEKFASILLSNVSDVYPEIVREHNERARFNRERPSLRNAIGRLETAEVMVIDQEVVKDVLVKDVADKDVGTTVEVMDLT
ncbi:hypothetical protein PF005_g6384 [Phytophthora fragariae]|uniref:Retrotransposon Copia-like N-terminal domain-containing protein n=1 Tax=Phytophthora fragariae TaxID=53985 RepID=A0A6A4E419_9STRA|nr:hypothetical protein PF003_g33179 [Phytophthora fragariae]KAE8943289.1 hypothetical protein PF009_g6979 [Phytophthora fragariae]KAE9020015.1 hypothetical protein PF011_g5600 [Phytophthora fragariae]KAE9124712.1 hypothetical protein PF010_g5908 [Phytophthora fragariae]KAE9124956.1 hypothetical protein PF007_g6531 [Phytophthora fragariae]